tara:strand:+ start:30999 stop:32078 length:1080 start_codon:yes stop_codon:yes gene_type:complete
MSGKRQNGIFNLYNILTGKIMMRILLRNVVLKLLGLFIVFGNSLSLYAQGAVLDPNSESDKMIITRYIQTRGANFFRDNAISYRNEFQNLASNANDSELEMLSDPITIAIPDRKDVVEVIISDGDMVGVQYRTTGTHLGNLFGIPATGKSIDIQSVGFYKLEDGLIVESFEMADEAALLKQLGRWLPDRADGLVVVPSNTFPVREGSHILMDILAKPEESDTYTNKVRVSAYKSQIRPFNQIFDGRPYETYTRAGFYHLGISGNHYGAGDQGIGPSFRHDRNDKVSLIIAEDNVVMILFLLTGTDTKGLFGNDPSNNTVGAWEAGVHLFDQTTWKEGWWFGDDIGMMLQIGAPPEFMIY